ncbi:MAG: hypothetical protein ACLS73_06990 [Bilophila wadsworthia]
MATRLSPADEAPFNIQIKNLADEELLDFWEETQQIESALRAEYQQTVVPVQITSVLSCWSCSCVPASARSPAEPDHLLNTSVSARPAPERPNGIGTLPLLREGFWRPCP